MIRILRQYSLVGFICLSFYLLSTLSIAADLPRVISAVKPSLVAVVTVLPTRRPPIKILGTGFSVEQSNLIVTNAHVVPPALDKDKKERLAVLVGSGSDTKIYYIEEVLAQDTVHDLSLLKIAKNSELIPMQIDGMGEVVEGEELLFSGYPIANVLGLYPVTHQAMVSAVSPIVIPVNASSQLNARLIRQLRDPFVIYQLDATAYPGSSGSPLYRQDSGKLVGVINMVAIKKSKEHVLSDPSGITYAIPVKYLQRLLEQIP